MSGQGEAEPRAARRLLIDLTPLRRSRDFRHLVWGELVSVLGNQLTTVAVPYQVYQLTHSSLDVGLVSVTQLFPLIAGSLLGGSAVDAMDRRRLLMIAQVLMAACSAGLAVNADLGPALWPLFVLPALSAGFSGLDSAGRNAIVPEPGAPVRGVHGATPSSRRCSSSAWWRGPRWPGCCWPGRGSASCTGWTWPGSGWRCSPCS